jgi:hypothetical protein
MPYIDDLAMPFTPDELFRALRLMRTPADQARSTVEEYLAIAADLQRSGRERVPEHIGVSLEMLAAFALLSPEVAERVERFRRDQLLGRLPAAMWPDEEAYWAELLESVQRRTQGRSDPPAV